MIVNLQIRFETSYFSYLLNVRLTIIGLLITEHVSWKIMTICRARFLISMIQFFSFLQIRSEQNAKGKKDGGLGINPSGTR